MSAQTGGSSSSSNGSSNVIVTRVEVCFPTAVQETMSAAAAGGERELGAGEGLPVRQADNILNFLTFFTIPCFLFDLMRPSVAHLSNEL